ncbi:MAG TPA: phosphatase PAP2 family protein [Vicinamibacteria bacterium]|nr:phosphatase PAP2 family protein [Vicinamibacteria bacterium]
MSPVLLVSHSDEWVAQRLRRWHVPPWFEVWMVASTRLGDGWAWLAVLLTSAAQGAAPSHVLAETAAAMVAVNGVQVVVNHAFRRSRPAPTGRCRVPAPDRFSFPSGHTMNAFASAVLVSMHLPAAALPAFAAAASVGASRVVLQLHFVSDVVAGAVLGSLLAAGVSAALAG